jgi:hypothetical protein
MELSVPAQEEAPVQSATWRRLALAAGLAASVSGCGLAHLQDLNFRVDDRLHFVSPKARTTVQQPLSFSWTMRDFTVAAPGSGPASRDAGYFAVFVDQAPIHPGQTLKAVGHGDPVCERDPKCPDRAYLNSHFVFTTTGTHLQLPRIPDLRGVKEKLQLHSITVVLVDTDGRRIGESAWELDVRIPKAGVT